jgi:hypothetical protein
VAVQSAIQQTAKRPFGGWWHHSPKMQIAVDQGFTGVFKFHFGA